MPLDGVTRSEHAYLSASDQCWYLAPYFPGSRHRGGAMNRLIANLKCTPSEAAWNRSRTLSKQRAIDSAAQMLRAALSRSLVESVTWIPIPPSHALGDPDFDDRLLRILRRAFSDYNVDVRDILYQVTSTTSDHLGKQRLGVTSLYERISINWYALTARSVRDRLVLFDDVLTTGKHFKCCERRLHGALPAISISGIFLARRALSGRWRCVP
jgi:predicted amidophosphoribosyltransferase